jgi:hypothetical protein
VRRSFLVAFAAFFLLGTAWALALPPNGTYDEKQHLVRAYAVWTGQWLPHERAKDASGIETNAFVGPRSLLPLDADCTFIDKPVYRPASCLVTTGDRTETLVPSAAARYSPVYYALVGLPLRISPDGTGLIWARLLSAALSALLLAWAVAIGWAGPHRLAGLGVLLATTPMLADLAGSINPNGLEISAAVLLFAAALQRRWAAAGVAALLLFTVRDLGPFFVLAALALSLFVTRTHPRELLNRALLIPASLGAAFAVFWAAVGSRSSDISDRPAAPPSTGAVLSDIAHNRAEFWVRQIVGQFNYGETTISIAVIGLWYLLVAALVVPALWFGVFRLRLAIAVALIGSFGLLVAMELYFAPRLGTHFAHGRYVMPLGVGVVLLAPLADRYAGWLAERRWLDRLVLLAAGLAALMQVYSLARVMTRFQRGIAAGLDPFGGAWTPPVGTLVPLICALVGGVLLGVIVTRSSVRPTPVHSTANTLSN